MTKTVTKVKTKRIEMPNKVILIGRLTAKPKMSETTSGFPRCRFVIACHSKFGEAEEVDKIDCVAYQTLAKAIVKVGDRGLICYIVGTLKTYAKYVSDDAKYVRKSEVRVDEFLVLTSYSERYDFNSSTRLDDAVMTRAFDYQRGTGRIRTEPVIDMSVPKTVVPIGGHSNAPKTGKKGKADTHSGTGQDAPHGANDGAERGVTDEIVYDTDDNGEPIPF